MRAILNTATVLAGIVLLVLVGYYLHKRDQPGPAGENYKFTDAPGDLIGEIASIFDNDEDEQPAPTPGDPFAVGTGSTTPPVPDEINAPPDFRAWETAREEYLAGNYVEALSSSLRARSGAPADQITRLKMRSRLFIELLAGVEPEVDADGPAVALLQMKSGDSMFVTVIDETDETISFKNEGGLGATLPKSNLKEFTVASTAEKKTALYEGEYQRRHSGLRGGAACLDLAKYCRQHGLDDHLTYLLERALDTGDKAIESALYDHYRESRKAGHASRTGRILDLMKHFFRSGDLTRKAVLDALPAVAGEPGINAAGPDDGNAGRPPASGIGGTDNRSPRVNNPEVNALLAKADTLRLEGNEYFAKTYPGHPDRVENRKKALDLYTKAIGIYEEVEEGWDVDLGPIFKDLMTKRYQLLKDQPVR